MPRRCCGYGYLYNILPYCEHTKLINFGVNAASSDKIAGYDALVFQTCQHNLHFPEGESAHFVQAVAVRAPVRPDEPAQPGVLLQPVAVLAELLAQRLVQALSTFRAAAREELRRQSLEGHQGF